MTTKIPYNPLTLGEIETVPLPRMSTLKTIAIEQFGKTTTEAYAADDLAIRNARVHLVNERATENYERRRELVEHYRREILIEWYHEHLNTTHTTDACGECEVCLEPPAQPWEAKTHCINPQ